MTVDFDTVNDGSITLRERDSTAQVRAAEGDVIQAIRNLGDGTETWEEVSRRLPCFTRQGNDE